MKKSAASKRGHGVRHTVLRYWSMAQIIPRWPAALSTAEITERLQAEGYRCDKRTVERDLLKLSDIFNYGEVTEGRTNKWFYPAMAKVLEIPAMQQPCALVMAMAESYLQPLLPESTLRMVKPYFNRAEDVLQQAEQLGGWRRRIQVVTPGLRLKAPGVEPAVQDAVYQAVLRGKQLQIDYSALGAGAPKPQLVHPQGLVLRDGVIYLVAAAWDYREARHYALHRMRKAECQEAAARTLPDFDFAAYVEREFSYPQSPSKLSLRLRAKSHLAAHLEERPLGDDQRIEAEDESSIVTATVADTDELRWWLLSFGAQVEVLKPLKLRRELARKTAEMAAMYVPESP
ncbi:MAG: WYL domain-containing protein [Pseudomonadota bacterium]